MNTESQLHALFRQPTPPTLILLCGQEPHGKSKAKETIKHAVVTPDLHTLNVEVLEAKDHAPQSVLDRCSDFPMMGGQRLIFVEDAGKWQGEALKAFTLTIKENPFPHTVLVLDFDQKSSAGLFRLRAPHVAHVDFSKPKAYEWPAFYQAMARSQGLEFTKEAALAFSERIGDQVAVAARELEKIALYLHPETLIPPEAVTVCSGRNRSVTPWEIQDLLLERQLPPILEKLQAIVDSGESPFSVLMATQRFLSSLMTIKFRLAQSQADEKELALSLRMPERAVRQLITHHRRFSSAELRAAFHELARLDDRLKSSRLRGDLLLHDFFCRWIPPGPYAPRSP